MTLATLQTAKSVQYVQNSSVSHDEVIDRLRQYIRRRCGNVDQCIAADMLGVHRNYLSEVLTGRRVPSPYLCSLVGLRRRKVYVFEED